MAWKAKHGPMKSVFCAEEKGKAVTRHVPESFGKMAWSFAEQLRKENGGNEIRALGANKVASPVLTVSVPG